MVLVEDLIADRTAPEMLEQARILYSLHPDCDTDYLERRIREETGGDHGIEHLN